MPAYVSWAGDASLLTISPPIRELFDFDRVFVPAGSTSIVHVHLGESVLALADTDGKLAIRAGRYTVAVGGHPGDEEQAAVTASFEIAGPTQVVLSLHELDARSEARKLERKRRAAV